MKEYKTMNTGSKNRINKMRQKKRNGYFGFSLLVVFVFCTIAGVFVMNNLSISKYKGIQEVTQQWLFDCSDLLLYAEVNEEDFTDLKSDFIVFYLPNDYCGIPLNTLFEPFFICDRLLSYNQKRPIYITSRSIRI